MHSKIFNKNVLDKQRNSNYYHEIEENRSRTRNDIGDEVKEE